MVADSITDSELFHGSPISRDFVKKRKTNWLGKLKQWKIDARRKQWMYQWKRVDVGEDENGSRLKSLREKSSDRKAGSEKFSNIRAWRIDLEEESCYDDDDCETDYERASSGSSPTSVLKNKDSHSNKSGEDCFCCSKQVTEEENDAFGDNLDSLSGALKSSENKETTTPLRLEHQEVQKPSTRPRRKKKPTAKNLHQNQKDDSEQQGSSSKTNRRCEEGSSSLEKAVQVQTDRRNEKKSDQQQESEECPLCIEAMDETDLSFFPCSCGYQVCLFCYEKNNKLNGNCPVCRKEYDPTSTNSGQVRFQQPSGCTLRLSTSFKALEEA